MTLSKEEIRRRVGQQFVVGFHGYEPSENIKTLIREYHVGSVILMKRNVQNAAQTRKLVKDLQLLAKESGQERPLLIGIDQENGLVSAFSSPAAGTHFPGAMALAATGSEKLAEQVSKATALELKSVGINWVYSPVGDVNSDSRNPVIGVRSFGDDPQRVAMFATAASRGLASAAVAPTGKHFPGHGDTHIDSHLALPRIAKTRQQLEGEELIPFKALIENGVPSIMTGHMALPLVTDGEVPCSLSAKITTEMLRNEFGFSGVVVTDCLEMDAIAEPTQGGCGVEVGALRAIQAGADIIMICHTFERQVGAIEKVCQAVEQGLVALEKLGESEARVERMKATYAGDWKEMLGNDDERGWEAAWSVLKANNRVLSQEAYSQSTTVVWNANRVLPLDKHKFTDKRKLLLFTPHPEAINPAVDSENGVLIGHDGVVKNTAGSSDLALARWLSVRTEVKHQVYGKGEEFKSDILSDKAAVLIVMRNADLKSWQLDFVDQICIKIRAARLPLVLMSSCGPYDLDANARKKYEDWTAYVATYEFTAEAFLSAVEVVFGEKEGRGRMPVVIT